MPAQKSDPWYDKKRYQAHHAIFAALDQLQQRYSETRERHLRCYKMYCDRSVAGFKPSEAHLGDGGNSPTGHPQAPDRRAGPAGSAGADLNAARAAVDYAHAKQVANRTRIQIVTSGGRWQLHTRARLMQRFIDGLWDEVGGYDEQDKQDLDSKIFGSGFLKINESIKRGKDGKMEGSVVVQSQPSADFWVDEQTARTCEPRDLFQERYVAARVLLERYGTEDILKARPNAVALKRSELEVLLENSRGDEGQTTITYQPRVVEAWHLPSGPPRQRRDKKGKPLEEDGRPVLETDGRHVICTSETTLVDEPWTWDDFAIVKQDWRKLPYEYWGQGMIEEAAGLQNYISATITNNERAHYFGSFPRWIAPEGCDVPEEYIDNDDSQPPPIWYFAGTQPPVLDAPNPVSSELLQQPQMLMHWMFDILGTSMMEAKGGEPAYDMSGKAAQHFSDLATLRYADKERHKEQCAVKAVKISLRTVRGMADRGVRVKAAYRGSGSLEVLDWESVALPEEDYRVEAFPTSHMPKQPAQRMAYVQQLMQMGVADPAFAFSLLEMPDVDEAGNIKLAPIRHAQWLCDQILYEGKTVEDLPPDPIMDLGLAIQWARSTYLYAQQMSAPEDTLDRLAEWITEAKNVDRADKQAMMAEQAAMMGPMAAAAGGAEGFRPDQPLGQ